VASEPDTAERQDEAATREGYELRSDGGRNRTGDTTIFRQAYATLELARNDLHTSRFWTAHVDATCLASSARMYRPLGHERGLVS